MKIMACNKVKTVSDYLEVREMYGYIPLGKSIPKNTRVKIKWRCPEDHIILMSYNQILRILTDFNTPCRICKPLLRYEIESYMEFKEKYGYTPQIEFAPDSANYPIIWKCPKEHEFKSSFRSIRTQLTANHTPCPTCSSVARKNGIGLYRETGERKGIKLLSPEVKIGTHHPHKWECSKGHSFWKTFHQVKNNDKLCPECNKVNESLYQLKTYFSESVNGEVNYIELGVPCDLYFIKGISKVCIFFTNKRTIQVDNNVNSIKTTRGYKSLLIYHKTEIPSITNLQNYVEMLTTEDHVTVFHLSDPSNF